MDTQPLVVDIGVSLPELSEIVVGADPRHLISGFIITDRGRYLGMGSVQDLVREVTAMQMEAAKYANPLTQLPGNVPINQHIDNLLAVQAPCCIAYCDLDHFKPFNDVYGYAKGDEVIQLTARALTGVCDGERDFVGHIGGDDFVMILRSEDWQERCRVALDRFGEEIRLFFSHDDIERGGYITENRKGELEFHRLTSLSIGAVEALPGMFQNHLQVSKVAAEVKKRAKAIPGNSLFVNQRVYAGEAPVKPAEAGEPA
jgi:diguanylate cyclase (GGDEF)-like protein